jgi:hypothetical protein
LITLTICDVDNHSKKINGSKTVQSEKLSKKRKSDYTFHSPRDLDEI